MKPYNMNKTIYNIRNKKASSINLWRETPSLFRVIQFDRLTSLMTGSDYTLIDKLIVPAFDELLTNEVEINPAKIYRKSTGESWDSYFELTIKEHIVVDKNEIRFNNECNIWQYKHHLFVSKSLGQRVEQISKGDLMFVEGFSRFG